MGYDQVVFDDVSTRRGDSPDHGYAVVVGQFEFGQPSSERGHVHPVLAGYAHRRGSHGFPVRQLSPSDAERIGGKKQRASEDVEEPLNVMRACPGTDPPIDRVVVSNEIVPKLVGKGQPSAPHGSAGVDHTYRAIT